DQGNLPEAIHGPGGAIGNGVHNLLIAVIAVHNVQVPHHRVNLIVNRGVENPVPRANYRLVLAKWIPSERNAWGKIIRVGVQGRVALIELVPDTVVESEVGPKGPRILPVASDQRIRIHDQSTAKTLNITLRQAQRGRLQSIHSSSARKTACIGPRWWRHQARAEHLPGQVAKKEPTGKVSVGVGVIAADQQVSAGLHLVPASAEGEIVGDLIAVGNSARRQEDVASKGAEAIDFELRPARIIGDHVKLVVNKLCAGFILSLRAEFVE